MARKARMNQEARSERSRGQILEAALRLFSTRGYHGTSMRDIAREAKVSTGNVYHQFPDKETLFKTLLDQYWAALDSPEFPFNKALSAGAFPDDLAALARAARASVEQYRDYVSLIYVDVVEFDGSHIRKFYSDMARRFEAFLAQHRDRIALDRLREGVHPLPAIMVASRFFLQYFAVEILFGVPNHFGRDTETALQQIVDILQFGMLKPEPASPAAPPGAVAERHGGVAASAEVRAGVAFEGATPASSVTGPAPRDAAPPAARTGEGSCAPDDMAKGADGGAGDRAAAGDQERRASGLAEGPAPGGAAGPADEVGRVPPAASTGRAATVEGEARRPAASDGIV